MKDIDVVIPLFNCTKFIEDAIRSAQNQIWAVNKIIVVNDGSTDDGPSKVARMSESDDRIVLLSGPNQGLSAARNKGIRASTAEFVAFLDADDLWEPDKIKKQLDCLLCSSFSFVHTQAAAVDLQGHPIEATLYKNNAQIEPSFENIRLGTYSVIGSASSVLTRRRLLLDAGLFNENMHFGGEDWDMWARLAKYGHAHLIDEPLTKIRLVPCSLQRSMSSKTRALSRLHSRIAVAARWQDDLLFLREHRVEGRKDAWAVARLLIFSPLQLSQFYMCLQRHEQAVGREIIHGPADFACLLFEGVWRTILGFACSSEERKRLFLKLRNLISLKSKYAL